MDIRNLIGLYEMFDTAVPYKWAVHNATYSSGNFTIDGVVYQVTITGGKPLQSKEELDDYMGDEAAVVAPGFDVFWDVEFNARRAEDRLPTHMNTGTGNQWKVYSTVIAMLREVMQRFGVGPIYMSAFDDSRASLYPRMMKKLLPGWHIHKEDLGGDGYEFIAYPPSVEKAA